MREIVIYITEISEADEKKNLGHMIGEELLRIGLKKEYGRELRFEPRDKGEHGKPFFTLLPGVYYNISHSGRFVACAFADQQVGLDIQEHRKASYDKILTRMVKDEEKEQILASENLVEEFFTQWVLREAFIKWTGEGLSRDLRTIDFGECWYEMLDVAEEYNAAVVAADPHQVRWVKVDISLINVGR